MSERAYIAIEGHARDWEEAIRFCGNELIRNAYVGQDFLNACIDREKKFPTGLPTSIPVAIPHAASDKVFRTAVCVMKLDESIRFQRMDEPSASVDVKLIFNLAIKGNDAHLDFLQKLIGFVMDENHLTKCVNLPIEEIPIYLENEIK
jgi:hypothetical protein